jgi:hypothetical protein
MSLEDWQQQDRIHANITKVLGEWAANKKKLEQASSLSMIDEAKAAHMQAEADYQREYLRQDADALKPLINAIKRTKLVWAKLSSSTTQGDFMSWKELQQAEWLYMEASYALHVMPEEFIDNVT